MYGGMPPSSPCSFLAHKCNTCSIKDHIQAVHNLMPMIKLLYSLHSLTANVLFAAQC